MKLPARIVNMSLKPRAYSSRAWMSALLVLLLLVSGCQGEPNARQIRTHIKKDVHTLVKSWNSDNGQAFIKKVNETNYLKTPTKDMIMASGLRRDIGKVVQRAKVNVTFAPKNKHLFAIAHAKMVMQRGVMTLILAYNKRLEIVGYRIKSDVTKTILPLPARQKGGSAAPSDT